METQISRLAVLTHELPVRHRRSQQRHHLPGDLLDRADRPLSACGSHGGLLCLLACARHVPCRHLVGFLHQPELFVARFLCLTAFFRLPFQFLDAPLQLQRLLVIFLRGRFVETSQLPVDVPIGGSGGTDRRGFASVRRLRTENRLLLLPAVVERHRQVLKRAHFFFLLPLEGVLLVSLTLVRRQSLVLRHRHVHVEAFL